MSKTNVLKQFDVISDAAVALDSLAAAMRVEGITDEELAYLNAQSDDWVARRDLAWFKFEDDLEDLEGAWVWKLIDKAVDILNKSIK